MVVISLVMYQLRFFKLCSPVIPFTVILKRSKTVSVKTSKQLTLVFQHGAVGENEVVWNGVSVVNHFWVKEEGGSEGVEIFMIQQMM